MYNQTDIETFFWISGQLRFFGGGLLKKPGSEFIIAGKIYE